MTTLTTILGLLSLLSSDLRIIQEFALVAAGGVLFAFIITILVVPILLSLIPLPQDRYHRQLQLGIVTKVLDWLGEWRLRRSIIAIAAVLVGVVPAVFILAHLDVGTNSLDYFKKDDHMRSQVEWIDSNIGGTQSLEFFIEAEEADALKDPALLRKMEAFQTYLEGIDGVTGVFSAVDLVKALNRGFLSGQAAAFTIPSSSAQITQQLFLVEGSDDFMALLSEDYSRARISARVEMNRTQDLAHSMPQIEQRIDEIFGPSPRITSTGLVHLMNETEHYLLTTSIKSFILAFLVITVTITLLLWSFKLGVLAMIPNFLPILFTMAIMPLIGISLDVGTTMIAAIALGLVVDDTIHFLSRLKTELAAADGFEVALATTMHTTGRPIVYTSFVLSLGFLVLVMASFKPIIHFGVLSCIVIFLAVLFDLLVLPAFFGLISPRLRNGVTSS
jgi:predicted RND superfamily exporter protein